MRTPSRLGVLTSEHLPAHQRAPGPYNYLSYIGSTIGADDRIAAVEIETPWSRRGRQRTNGRFFKAAPLPPLQRAARLPGRALALYLAIRHRVDLRRGQAVTLPAAYLENWGINRHAKDRALVALEKAGLAPAGV